METPTGTPSGEATTLEFNRQVMCVSEPSPNKVTLL